VQVVHLRDGDRRVLASDAERAEGLPAKIRGLMFRRDLSTGYGLVFPFEEAAARSIHMVFVSIPLDVLWLVGDEVTRVERLSPWTGFARSPADTVVELPAGAAEGVEAGDTVETTE
jgi:uncharacterized membrane protein (UPF0127 family)